LNYECHITIALADAALGHSTAERLHWTTSEIERDPVLGKASYFYLTSHSSDFLLMHDRMRAAIESLRADGCHVIREKIELIVYDVRHKP